MYKQLLTVIAITVIFITGSNTRADEPLEEIVVTAGFYDTELMKSAGSTSVLDEQTLADRAARHLDETLNALPNVNFSSGGSRARFVQVRGIGDLEQFVDPKHFPSVGITIDDIDIGTTANGAVLMDVDQIELLRGPQGTRFGANALAGIINIQTHDPQDSFSGTIEAGYASYDSWQVGAILSGPLSESIRGRLAVRQNTSDGFTKNAFLDREDTNDRDELSVRGKLHWYGDNGAAINLTAFYVDLDSGYDAFSLDNTRTTLSDQPGQDRQETVGLALKGTVPVLDGVDLEALLNWSDADEAYGYDEDWVYRGFCDGIRCNPLFEFSNTDLILRDRNMVSLDVRLKSEPDRITWVTGLYAQHRNEDLERQYYGTFLSDYETERYAAYGQVQIVLAQNWNVIAGLRYEHFEDNYDDTNGLITDSTDDYWSGKLSLEYLLDDNTLLYGTLSRGVKPGGVNTETSSNQPFMAAVFQPFLTPRLQFAAETLFNKELGIKGRYLDDRLAVRLTLFHMDRSNAQLESWVWDANNFIWTGFLDSNSDAENYGAELELRYRLSELFHLFANVGYLETSVDKLTVFDLDRGQLVEITDRDQTKAPNWQYNFGVEININDKLQGMFEVEGRDKSYYGYYHNGRIGSYTTANASVSYKIGDFTIQGWIRNMFDKDYAVHGLYFANDPRDVYSVNRTYYQYGEPRVYGLNVSYAF